MRILLIQPKAEGGLGFSGVSYLEPLGLEAIAAPLKDGHDLKLIDFFTFDDLGRFLKSFEPHICAISCSFAMDVNRTLRIAECIKRSRGKSLVVVGGHHASLSPADFHKPFIDAVVIGEGEVTFSELVNSLERNGDLKDVPGLALNRDGEQLFTETRGLVPDLDKFPLPARHLSQPFRKRYFLGFEHPVATVETTRGCPYRCTFCSVPEFFRGTVRFKSPQRVVQELSNLDEEMVLFSDDNFLVDAHRAEQIAALIRESKIRKRYLIQARSDTIVRHPKLVPMWQELGLVGMLIGFEKIDEEGLKSINKGNTIANNEKALEILRSYNMGIVATFIVDPAETYEDFARLRRYIERLQIKNPAFCVLTPFPGTELFKQTKDKLVTKNYELFDCLHAVLPTKLPLPEFYRELSKLYTSAFKQSMAGRIGILRAMKGLWQRRISPFQMREFIKTARMFTEPDNYLVAHMNDEDYSTSRG